MHEETVEEALARGVPITRRRLTLKRPPEALPPAITPDLPQRPRQRRNGHAERERAAFRRAEAEVERVEPPPPGTITAEDRRTAAAGGAGTDYPADALHKLGYITAEALRECERLTATFWALYGSTPPGVGALWQRVAASVDENLLTQPDRATLTPEEHEERILKMKRRLERMLRALGGLRSGDIVRQRIAGTLRYGHLPRYDTRRGTMMGSIDALAVRLERPALLRKLHPIPGIEEGGIPTPHDLMEMALIVEGLERLVTLNTAEDRYQRGLERDALREYRRHA